MGDTQCKGVTGGDEKGLPDEGHTPLVEALHERLTEQGYGAAVLPALRGHERVLPRITSFSYEEAREELTVFEATLGRIEYEMAKLDFGVRVRVDIPKRGKPVATRQRNFEIGPPVRFWYRQLKGRGRVFLPNDEIRRFISESSVKREQKSGVGVAFSIKRAAWIAFLIPYSDRKLAAGFVKQHASKERIPLTQSDVHGGGAAWLLRGKQKQPLRLARFLKRVWSEYQADEPTGV